MAEQGDAPRPKTSTRDCDELARHLEAWLGTKVKDPRVSGVVVPESNGMSSETLLFDVSWSHEDGRRTIGCAARLSPDPDAVPVFPEYDLERQFKVMRLVGERSTVPVPATLWIEPDPEPIGAPFLVMERVEGLVPPDIMPYPFGSWLSEATPREQRHLQDASVGVLAALHDMDVGHEDIAFLELDRPGGTALRRHVAEQRAYYDWVVADGMRSPLLERTFSWLEDHWPEDEGDAVVSWGDSRIGNVMYRDFEPVAVLDWEMAATGPREIDIGWMIYLHRFLDDIAVEAELPGMPDFMRIDDVTSTYEGLSGHRPSAMEFHTMYAALRHGIVMSRVARRQILFGEIEAPADPDDMIMHRATLERMLEGTYWAGV
jgi:aminoglycoside phosphotransferase (APT) family kinase protein